jgi:hypothetical protein
MALKDMLLELPTHSRVRFVNPSNLKFFQIFANRLYMVELSYVLEVFRKTMMSSRRCYHLLYLTVSAGNPESEKPCGDLGNSTSF